MTNNSLVEICKLWHSMLNPHTNKQIKTGRQLSDSITTTLRQRDDLMRLR